jgi:nicotinamidase-related amidase
MQCHVCVQQTAFDLVAKGFDVHVIADGVSSRSLTDRMFALEVRWRDTCHVICLFTTIGNSAFLCVFNCG